VSVNNVARVVQSLIDRPTAIQLAVALGVSASLLLIALFLQLSVRRRWVGLTIGAIGLATTVGVLIIVDQQTITTRESESVTVTRPRYRERTRASARGALITVPCLGVLAAVAAWAAARRRLKNSVPGIVKAGRMHLFVKEYDAALAQFSRAIRISPFLADAYSGRGAAYLGLGDIQHALADFDRAIQNDPRLTQAFMQRARIRTETGDLDGALADLSRVMELQPSDPELYLNRGICFFKKGHAADAIADFHRVLKLTNHSDFAEPAKDYLLRLEHQASGIPYPSPLQPPQFNGLPDPSAVPEARAKDHTT
jgi:tetratricopeptide (TPR) repeat protein